MCMWTFCSFFVLFFVPFLCCIVCRCITISVKLRNFWPWYTAFTRHWPSTGMNSLHKNTIWHMSRLLPGHNLWKVDSDIKVIEAPVLTEVQMCQSSTWILTTMGVNQAKAYSASLVGMSESPISDSPSSTLHDLYWQLLVFAFLSQAPSVSSSLLLHMILLTTLPAHCSFVHSTPGSHVPLLFAMETGKVWLHTWAGHFMHTLDFLRLLLILATNLVDFSEKPHNC